MKNNSAVMIRPVKRSDSSALIKSNIESLEYHSPWVSPFTSLDAFNEWYAERIMGNHVSLVALEKNTQAIVGVINFSQIFLKGFCNAYLGYYGMHAFAGQGLMHQAVSQAIDYGFEEIGLHRIEANIQPENHRSIALVKKLGFQLEGYSPQYLKIAGEWRDHERWALVRTD